MRAGRVAGAVANADAPDLRSPGRAQTTSASNLESSHTAAGASQMPYALKRRLLLGLLILTITFTGYVGSFVYLRQWLNMTPHPVNPRTGEVIAWYYFSRDPTLNEAAFYLFYPIHQWTLGGYAASTLERANATEWSLEPGRAIYIDRIPNWPWP